MKFKKIMLVTFILLAILTISAASAADDVASDDLAVSDDGDAVVADPEDEGDGDGSNDEPDEEIWINDYGDISDEGDNVVDVKANNDTDYSLQVVQKAENEEDIDTVLSTIELNSSFENKDIWEEDDRFTIYSIKLVDVNFEGVSDGDIIIFKLFGDDGFITSNEAIYHNVEGTITFEGGPELWVSEDEIESDSDVVVQVKVYNGTEATLLISKDEETILEVSLDDIESKDAWENDRYTIYTITREMLNLENIEDGNLIKFELSNTDEFIIADCRYIIRIDGDVISFGEADDPADDEWDGEDGVIINVLVGDDDYEFDLNSDLEAPFALISVSNELQGFIRIYIYDDEEDQWNIFFEKSLSEITNNEVDEENEGFTVYFISLNDFGDRLNDVLEERYFEIGFWNDEDNRIDNRPYNIEYYDGESIVKFWQAVGDEEDDEWDGEDGVIINVLVGDDDYEFDLDNGLNEAFAFISVSDDLSGNIRIWVYDEEEDEDVIFFEKSLSEITNKDVDTDNEGFTVYSICLSDFGENLNTVLDWGYFEIGFFQDDDGDLNRVDSRGYNIEIDEENDNIIRFWQADGDDDEDDEGPYVGIFIDLEKDYPTSGEGDEYFINITTPIGFEGRVRIFGSNKFFFDKNLTEFEDNKVQVVDDGLEAYSIYSISLKDVGFFEGLEALDRFIIEVVEPDAAKNLFTSKFYKISFNDDSTFTLLDLFEIRVFYGNLTSGETEDGMISYATDKFMEISIPSSSKVDEINVAVDYGDETITYSLNDFDYEEVSDEEFSGKIYYIELNDEIKNKIFQHENQNITFNFSYVFKGKTISASFKRVLMDDLFCKIVSISDLYCLFDFNIEDEVLNGSDDEVVSIFCFDSNWHVAHNDLGGGIFKVYVNGTYVKSVDLFSQIVHGAPQGVSFSLDDLGISTSGNYTIKITQLPEEDIEYDEVTGELIPHYKLAIENELISKVVVVKFEDDYEPVDPELKVTVSDITVGQTATVNIEMNDDVNGEVLLSLDGANYTVTLTNGNGTCDIAGLKAGDYYVAVKFKGNDQYNPAENTTSFKVSKLAPSIVITAGEAVEGSDLEVTVTIDDATGNVTINGQNVTLKDGKAIVTISNVPVGDLTIVVNYSGDDKYLSDSKSETVNVKAKQVSGLTVTVSDITVGQTATVNIIINSSVTGKVTINGNEVTITDGKGTYEISDLTAGEHSVTVVFEGDKYFKATDVSKTFNVKAPLSKTVTPDTFSNYFDENGVYAADLDEIIFAGEFTGIAKITINKPLNITGENAVFNNTLFNINSDNVLIKDLTINNDATDYALTVTGSDVSIIANNFNAINSIMISSSANFNIQSNNIANVAGEDSCGILITGTGSGTIRDNNLDLKSTKTVYAMNTKPAGSLKVKYINNTINAESYFAVGIYDDSELIKDNKITLSGNYSIGIAVLSDDANVENNTIILKTTNNGSEEIDEPLGVQTAGIVVNNTATIINNNVDSTGKSLSLTGGSSTISGNDLTGQATISSTGNTLSNNKITSQEGSAVVLTAEGNTIDNNELYSSTGNGNDAISGAEGNTIANNYKKVDPKLTISPISDVEQGSAVSVLITANETFTGTVKVLIGTTEVATIEVTNGKGNGIIAADKLSVGDITITVKSDENNNFTAGEVKATFKVNAKPAAPVTPVTPTKKADVIKLTLKTVKVKKSAKKLIIKATLKINGKAVKGKKLKFKFNKKTYTAKTNKKGVAKIKVTKKVLKKLKVGKKITIKVSYGKKTAKQKIKVKK